MKIFNIICIILFVLFAAVQYNDPDPYIWVPIYLFAAWLCFQSIRHRYNRMLYIIGLVLYGLYALYLLFDQSGVIDWITEHHGENIVQSMKATKPWIEETREFFGLIIVICVLMINMNWLSLKKKIKEGKLS